MRVFHLCSSSLESPYFGNLYRGLSAQGISVLSGSLSEPAPPSWLPDDERENYFAFGARSRLSYPSAAFRLGRLLRRERIDILQTHLFDAGVVGLIGAKYARDSFSVITRHHLDDVWLGGTRFHVALDRWMARNADRVVVPSHAVRDHMASRERLDEERIDVIHYGFNFESLSATEDDRQRVRAGFGLESEFVIGCVARFVKNKGHAYLLAALKEIAREIPDVRLLLLGSGNKASIERMAREHGVEERVIFAGHRTDVAACIKAMDAVVHPSLTEAFCQVIIETMAVGTPLVATNVGGAPEVITHGETGMLVPPADPDAIANAVIELYRSPRLRQSIAATGQRSVRAKFTVERMVSQQVQCYERLLGRTLDARHKYAASY